MPSRFRGKAFSFVGVAGLPLVILVRGDLNEKAFHSLRSFTGFIFALLMNASIQRNSKIKPSRFRGKAFSFVGVAGFEPATLWSQTINIPIFTNFSFSSFSLKISDIQ
jgi:hypothetical protein